MRDEKPTPCRGGGIVALDNAEVKYSTVQNWYPGIRKAKGIYNLLPKRGMCKGSLENFLDTCRDRLCHHLEIPELHPDG